MIKTWSWHKNQIMVLLICYRICCIATVFELTYFVKLPTLNKFEWIKYTWYKVTWIIFTKLDKLLFYEKDSYFCFLYNWRDKRHENAVVSVDRRATKFNDLEISVLVKLGPKIKTVRLSIHSSMYNSMVMLTFFAFN